MMRKVLFLLPFVALTVASCSNSSELESNERVLNANELRFRTMMGNATRAASIDLAALQTSGFKVLISGDAITTDANTSNDSPAATHFNDEVAVSWSGTAWALASELYWDRGNGNTATFLAYNNSYAGGTSYSVPADIDDQQDLVMAYNTGTRAANASSGVALNFKHLLSQIQIKATNASTNKKVEVIGVKISNFGTTSTLTKPTTADFTPAWGELSDVKTLGAYRDEDADAVTLTAAAQDIMFGHGFFMVLPQSIEAADLTSASTTGFYISLLVKITNISDPENPQAIYPAITEEGDPEYAFTSIALPAEWEAGKRYVYTLNFYTTDSGAGQIDPNPSDPGSGDQPTDDDDIDDEPGEPGAAADDTDQLPLAFTVTVEDRVEVPSSQSLGD